MRPSVVEFGSDRVRVTSTSGVAALLEEVALEEWDGAEWSPGDPVTVGAEGVVALPVTSPGIYRLVNESDERSFGIFFVRRADS